MRPRAGANALGNPRKSGPARASRQSERTTQPPVIAVRGGGLSRQATAGERAILFLGAPVYQRGASLVRPILEEVYAADGRRTKVAQLVQIELPYMLDLLCRSARWRICKLAVRMRSRATRTKPRRPIGTSSLFGKMPIPTYPS